MKKPKKKENCPVCGKMMNLQKEIKKVALNKTVIYTKSPKGSTRQFYRCNQETPFPHTTIVYVRKSKK